MVTSTVLEHRNGNKKYDWLLLYTAVVKLEVEALGTCPMRRKV